MRFEPGGPARQPAVHRLKFQSQIDHAVLILSAAVRTSHMPRLTQPIIEVAWRHTGEVGKIHYRARRADGSNRHLIARKGEALYELLEQHLQAIGYTGPKSGTEEAEEH